MRIPLAITLDTRDGTTSKDAQLRNAIVSDGQVVKRGGIPVALATATGAAQGLAASNTLLFAVNGDSLRIYNSSFVLQSTTIL